MSNRSKFAFVIRMYQEKTFHGGGEKLFYYLINRLKTDGHNVDIYCRETDNPTEQIKVIKEHYDHNKPETMEAFYRKASEIIQNKDYDYVISENITPPLGITFLQGHSLINRVKKTKNPLEAFFYNFRKIKRERIKAQEKWIKQGYIKIFVVSELLKQDIAENFDVQPNNISVIYPGVDLPESFSALPQDDIVTFGLLAPGFKIKGGFIFLNAIALLKKKGYKFKARIVYPKHKKNLGVKSLISLYKIGDCVEFLNYQKDMAAFYNSIDCLVAPSIEDTFNLAALEAMAHYKPVIISNNAGACEIIKEGENGYVFDIRKKGAENLAEKLKYYLAHKAAIQEKLAQNARKTAEEYSWDRFYQRFNEEIAGL
jgi:glycosyltransferase involved in cell wall biosynthesis